MAQFVPATSHRVAALIAPGLEEVEALAVVDLLYRAGVRTDMIAVGPQVQVVSSHGITLTCDHVLDQVDLADYDLLFLPGGIPGTPNLDACEPLMAEVEARVRAGRPVAAICAAPSILARRGLLEGCRATSNPAFTDVLAEHGALVSQDSVVVDGTLFTSRGMATAVDLGLEIVRYYLGDDAVENLKKAVVYQR